MTQISDSWNAFLRAIEQAGLTPPERIVADGRLHRFSSNGDPGDDAGWYILHTDGIPAGAFGCWRSGVNETWSSRAASTMTAAERADHARQLTQLQHLRDEEARLHHAEVAQRVQAFWDQAAPAPVSHPYLRRKQVRSHGLRVEGENRLIVPVTIGGTLSRLQFIAPNMEKRFKALIDDLITVTQPEVDKAQGILRELVGGQIRLHASSDGAERFLTAELSGNYSGLVGLVLGLKIKLVAVSRIERETRGL